MHRYLWLVAFASLITAVPALAQESNQPSAPPDQPFTPSGEIPIPSGAALDRMLDSPAVAPRGEEVSPKDPSNRALKEMEERDQRINRDVMKGICKDC